MPIVAAISDSTRDTVVIQEGKKLAERLGEELFVVIVMNLSKFVELEKTSIETTGEGLKVEVAETMAEDVASDLAAEAIGTDFDYQVEGFIGEPVEELLKFADTHDVDYLVIGGRNRSRLGKLVFGSTAQAILLNAERPVVSVRVDTED